MKAGAAILPGLTREGLAALLERHGFGPLRSVEPLDDGTSNPTLRINDELVIRCNSREPEVPRLRWEALIYGRLRREAVVPGPEALALDTRRDLVPFDVLFLSRVEGVAADAVWPSLDDTARDALSEELGRRVGAIHALRWPAYGEGGVGGADVLSPRWTDLVLRKSVRAYERAARLGIFAPRVLDGVITTVNDADAVFDAASPPALVHGDLWLAHVVLRQVDGEWTVAAIVDWQDAIVADAAWELADLWSRRYGDPLYPLPGAFMHGYRQRYAVPGDLQVRRKLYRLLHLFEHAVRCGEQLGIAADRTLHNVRSVERLLQAH